MKNREIIWDVFGGRLSWEFITYCIFLFSFFVLFQQDDLLHTYKSSYAYLNGYFRDFYDYNWQQVGGNDYLPLLYAIFALWNLPLHLLGLITNPELIDPSLFMIQVAWSKLLLVFFFFASVRVLTSITQEFLTADSSLKNRPVSLLFATAPVAIFSVFIFGQYDVIGLFFSLVGYYFYVKKEMWRFALFFSLAISFKYFAFVIFVPLVLMAEKNPLNIIKWILVSWGVVVLEVCMYSHSAIFLDEIFTLLRIKTLGTNNERLSTHTPTLYCCVLYALGCTYLYFKKYRSLRDWLRDSVLAPIAAYGLMFAAIPWHPQWMIILMPFYALGYLYINNTKVLIISEIVGMFIFIWLCVIIWPNNVDVTMIKNGMLGQFLPAPLHLGSDFLNQKPKRVLAGLLYLSFFLPLFLCLLQGRYSKLKKPVELSPKWVFTRFLIGNSIFILLVIVAFI